ncbi:MAG: hypothetical protein FWF04_05185, partial [Clostridiales bacterium]|nr:hypothetical protein [Clostridiales bacterium]
MNDKEGTVTLQNAGQLFKAYEAVSGTFAGPGGNIPFKFTPEQTVLELAKAKDYAITNLIATGTGIGNNMDARINGQYKEFSTKLAPSFVDYALSLETAQAEYAAEDTIYVDVMLTGNTNYTQVNTAIAYDADVLQFAGYENLGGLTAEVKKVGGDMISVRSVPSLNMMIGVPCAAPVRVVTLKFTVNGGLTADAVKTALSFSSIAVTPTAGVVGVTTAPGNTLRLTLSN